MKNQSTISRATRVMCGVAVFSAMAFCASLVTNIPIGFLTFDVKDAVITIASFIYGPISAVFMTVITAFLEFVTVGNTGLWGLLMDIISTAAFAVTASVIYAYRHRLSGAIISLGTASVIYVAVMMVANLLITPQYMGVGVETVKQMIPTMLLPFNIAKALMNSALVMLIYKPVSNLTKRIGFNLYSKDTPSASSKRHDTFIMLTIASVLFIISIIIFIILAK